MRVRVRVRLMWKNNTCLYETIVVEIYNRNQSEITGRKRVGLPSSEVVLVVVVVSA